MKDYYYSEKHDAHLDDCYAFDRETRFDCKFKGESFTEQIAHGHKPITLKFDDLIYLGSGSDSDCTYEPMKI
jgi:hypothetical protein